MVVSSSRWTVCQWCLNALSYLDRDSDILKDKLYNNLNLLQGGRGVVVVLSSLGPC